MTNYSTTKACKCKHHIGDRERPLLEFMCNISKTYPTGVRNTCIECVKLQRRIDRVKHQDHIKQKLAEWRAANKDYTAAYGKQYRASSHGCAVRQQSYVKNRNQKRTYDKHRWKSDETVRARHAAICAKRRALLLKATPPWFYQEEEAVQRLYAECANVSATTGVEHQVDHMVPVQSEIVCGLHCLANLQIITATENQSKGNRWSSD